MRTAFLAVLALTVPTLAQVSPDEANARLAQRQAEERAAATQPAKITSADLNAMERELASLRNEVKRLLADNAALKDRINKMTAAPATKPADRITRAIRDGKILIGMTEDEARQAAKRDLILSPAAPFRPSPSDASISESRGEDADGNTSMVWSNWRASVTVIMREGKVVSYRENK